MVTTEGAEYVVRNLPAEWKGLVPTEVFFEEARGIVEHANEKGVTLRIMGGMGIAFHSADYRDFAKRLGRVGASGGQEYSDLDFAAYMKQKDLIVKLFVTDLGYIKRRTTLSSAASQRQIYFHPKGWFYIDVLLDKLLVANHPLDFRARLQLDSPTIPVSDLLLEKLQMWEAFSEKDLKDCFLLLKAHEVTQHDANCINKEFIARLLAQDWGFWYTVTGNLKKIRRITEDLDQMGPKVGIHPSEISQVERAELVMRIERLLQRIDEEPKSLSWKLRSKIGTSKKWYEHVETPETVAGFGIWHMKDVFPA